MFFIVGRGSVANRKQIARGDMHYGTALNTTVDTVNGLIYTVGCTDRCHLIQRPLLSSY